MREALDPVNYRDLVARALAEDLGSGDVTTAAIVPSSLETEGVFLAKEELVVAGLDVARSVIDVVDASSVFDPRVSDGALVARGTVLARVAGKAASLLVAERSALNFLQHLSGVATLTRRFVEASCGRIVVLDTRKTTPGLRYLEKYAVRCGGGQNHRMGLFDAILVKDNHIRVAGSVTEAVGRLRSAGLTGPVEIEAQTLEQVEEALAVGAHTIMLDNLDDSDTADAIRRIGGRAKVELSGNMSEARVARLAGSGADFVSIGALTHSARAVDISLELAL